VLQWADKLLEERTQTIINKQRDDEKRLLQTKIWKYEQEIFEQEKRRIAWISNEYNIIREKRKEEYMKEKMKDRIHQKY